MSDKPKDKAWITFGDAGMWTPSERPGWWLRFRGTSGPASSGYGPFPTPENARTYLTWALEEAVVNRSGEPFIVRALRSAKSVEVVEVP